MSSGIAKAASSSLTSKNKNKNKNSKMDIFKSEETTLVDFLTAAHKNRTTVMDTLFLWNWKLPQKPKTMNDQKVEQLCSMLLSNTCFK